jgi:hypothetical protein
VFPEGNLHGFRDPALIVVDFKRSYERGENPLVLTIINE